MIGGIFVEGLIFGILVLGVFITFRILDFPDLTVDGSYATGAAVMAVCITSGAGIFVGFILAIVSGLIAGAVTATITNRLKVPGLLAGILTMTMLYSVNIRILGGANLPLLRVDTIFTFFAEGPAKNLPTDIAQLILVVAIILIIKVIMDLFFHTDMGLTLGAMGNNPQMVRSQGVSPELMKVIGVGLSNALVALSGAIMTQYQGFADAKLGQGRVVEGLAAVMIGEFLIRSNKISYLTLRVILGAILYKALMFAGRYYGYYIHMTPSDLKLVTGILIILALVVAKTRDAAMKRKVK